ncbi:MAG: helix-turn-helix transcriptional regulator [Clostridia bacterium]|nr:helix-turn-helix transcriptional regulator [Clostridia bacterium]
MNNVLNLRQKMSMTQDEFADYCNVSRISIARFETGSNISRASAERIAKACGVSVSYVLGDLHETNKQAQEQYSVERLIELLMSLSPPEVQRATDFVLGIIAADKSESSGSR